MPSPAAVDAACGAPENGCVRAIAVGGQSQMVYLPTTLAQELGFYRTKASRSELQDFAGGAKALQALVGGSADVVSGFYDHTIQMAAEGREFVAFVTMLRFPGLVLVDVAAERAPTLTTIEDSQRTDRRRHHRRVVVADAADVSAAAALVLAADAVSITAIGSAATAIAALEHGKVDVGMVADPAFTLMHRRNPSVRVLADLRTGEGVNAALGHARRIRRRCCTRKASGSARTATPRQRLARAIRRTLAWMQAHTPQEIAEKTPEDLSRAKTMLSTSRRSRTRCRCSRPMA